MCVWGGGEGLIVLSWGLGGGGRSSVWWLVGGWGGGGSAGLGSLVKGLEILGVYRSEITMLVRIVAG